jgi:hypothetical protein
MRRAPVRGPSINRFFGRYCAVLALFGVLPDAFAYDTKPFDYVRDECWQSESYRFRFSEDGKVERVDLKSGKTTTGLRLPLFDYLGLGVIGVHSMESDIAILYAVADGGWGKGALCRYRQNPWSRRWCLTYPSGNLLGAVSNDGSLYVAGTGFAGRVNSSSGEFIWRHEGLYSVAMQFNGVRLPYESESEVTFEAVPSSGRKGPLVLLKIDRSTGAIKSYEKFDAQGRAAKGKSPYAGTSGLCTADPSGK